MNFAIPILWLGSANGYHGLNDANGGIDVLTWLGTGLPVVPICHGPRRLISTPNHWLPSAIPSHQRGVGHRHERRGGMRWMRQRFARDMVAGRVGERPVSDHQASGRG